jgi:hypothetical protein
VKFIFHLKIFTACELRFCSGMKIRMPMLALYLAIGLGFASFHATAELEASAGVSIRSVNDFYEPLASSGTWVQAGSYGRCWHPAHVASGWRPYCNGYWEWTDAGWYWASDEPWGWACYHYGSWVDDPGFGWCWVPDVEWAPAWVNWRMGGDYIGWSPCGPSGFVVAPSEYVFVENRHFNGHIRSRNVIVNNVTIINNTTEIKNVRRDSRQFNGKSQTDIINQGPDVNTMAKATGHKFTAVSIQTADRQTFASIPKKLKNRPVKPVSDEKAGLMPEQPNPVPAKNPEFPADIPQKKEIPVEKVPPVDKTVPHSPSDKNIHPADKELPLNQIPAHPKEITPPSQPSPTPMPPGNPVPDDRGPEIHGHDNP